MTQTPLGGIDEIDVIKKDGSKVRIKLKTVAIQKPNALQVEIATPAKQKPAKPEAAE